MCYAAAAAAAKSLKSCPTLRNPIDRSPPGSPVPGILQARTLVGCHFLLQCMKVKSGSEVAQPCPTLHDPMDCSPPGSSVHGILQARILEWVAISFSRGSSQPRDRTWVSHIGGRSFNLRATREAKTDALNSGSETSLGIHLMKGLSLAENVPDEKDKILSI